MLASSGRAPIRVPCRWRATSPAWVSNICSIAGPALGRLCSSTFRVTASTSASVSSTAMRKRSRSHISAGAPAESADLPCAHQHDAAVELRLHRLGHFREGGGAILGLVDVLLHLVEHEDGVRQLAVHGVREQGKPRGLDELFGRDVGPQWRELPGQQLPGRLDVGREAGVRGDERARDEGADIQVVELPEPLLPRLLDRGAHSGEQPLLAQPEAEARLRVLRGQAARAEQYRQHGVTNVVDAAAEQGPGGRHRRPSGPVRVGIQLAKLRLHLVGQAAAHETAGRRSVGELGIGPQVGEHLQEVRLAATEEAAHPG